MNRLISACFLRRLRGSLVLPISRNRRNPKYGMRKMTRSQAMAVCGLRLIGTISSAVTLMATSMMMSAAVMVTANHPSGNGRLPEVHELQVDVQVSALEQRHGGLQVVPA